MRDDPIGFPHARRAAFGPRSSSLFPPNYDAQAALATNPNVRLPRTSSLIQKPRIGAPLLQQGDSNRSPQLSLATTLPSTSEDELATESEIPDGFYNLKRRSSSTESSRKSLSAPRISGINALRRASIDATDFLASAQLDPRSPSSKRLRKKSSASTASNRSASTLSEPTFVPEISPQAPNLPAIALLPSLEDTFPHDPIDLVPETADINNPPRRPPPHPPRNLLSDSPLPVASLSKPIMPYDSGREAGSARGTPRGRAGKGSNDSSQGRGAKPPSQKAMLSRALQKANTAVQLDNAQNFEGARQAYEEACNLLHHVLERTTADEDKRKLEAIRQTYTSRIDELDQMSPWLEAENKALPARPESEDYRPGSVLRVAADHTRDRDEEYGEEDGAIVETATVTRIVRETDDGGLSAPLHPPPAPHQQYGQAMRAGPHLVQPPTHRPPQPPEFGMLQSSFTRSPMVSRFQNSDLLRTPSEPYIPAPLSPRLASPQRPTETNDVGSSGRSEFSLPTTFSHATESAVHHARQPSQNSWLDPIDESGGSTASSVHSQTSSLRYRRRHIRNASGDTEAEFDTALDAAIEAAYDDGYEPMSAEDMDSDEPPNEDIVANALRKVELARERVRQTEREALEMANERERQRRLQLGLRNASRDAPEDFFDDNSSDEEERILEEMTRDLAMEDFGLKQKSQPSIPRESDSSGLTNRTWHSSTGSNPMTGATSLSTVAESVPPRLPTTDLAAPAPPPTHSLPNLPPLPPPPGQSVQKRRISRQNTRELKIQTTELGQPAPRFDNDLMRDGSAIADENDDLLSEETLTMNPRATSPPNGPSPIEPKALGSPLAIRPQPDGDEPSSTRAGSPSVNKLRKNFSSSSLRSLKSRNMSLTNLDDASDMSPGTPLNSQPGFSRAPAVPALPTPLAATFREKADGSAIGGLYLFDDQFHSPESPGTPNPMALDAPVPLEPCPTDFMLRPFWLMRCLYQTLVHPRGGYISSKLFVPRDVWRVKGTKLKNVDEKIAHCDFLTAALLKLAKVDSFDADAVLEEMQALEGVLEQVQAVLTRKLGNEVGVQGSSQLFKDATAVVDGDGGSAMPRSVSTTAKSSSFSWRRLRSKNSAAALSGQYGNKPMSADGAKETPSLPTLPMTEHPTSRPAKRDIALAQFVGPNANYMNSLARLFDAAQAIDLIARQVEDPGLRHADKTQVGLELCTRHAAEFFGFYICRFVLADLGVLLDKFIKRGSEWVLA